MTDRKFAEFVFDSLGHELLEAVLYKDGGAWLRTVGSRDSDEEDIVAIVPLSWAYWWESWIFDVLYIWDTEAGRFGRAEVAEEWLKKAIIKTIGEEVIKYQV